MCVREREWNIRIMQEEKEIRNYSTKLRPRAATRSGEARRMQKQWLRKTSKSELGLGSGLDWLGSGKSGRVGAQGASGTGSGRIMVEFGSARGRRVPLGKASCRLPFVRRDRAARQTFDGQQGNGNREPTEHRP